jgi:hypothetical protein
MSFINVEPKPSNIVKVNIRIYNVALFTSLSAYISQYNEQNEVIKTNDISLTTQEYNSWQNDEDLVNLLLNKVGLQKQEENENKQEDQPIEEKKDDPLPVEEEKQEDQPVEEKKDDPLPVEEEKQEDQPVEEEKQEDQPVEEEKQEEVEEKKEE